MVLLTDGSASSIPNLLGLTGQIALEKGYFEFPKKITLRQLAKVLDISPGTLTEILRRGQKRVLQEHFKGRPSVLTRQEKVFPV